MIPACRRESPNQRGAKGLSSLSTASFIPIMPHHGHPNHRVYMSFSLSRGWYCQFLEVDLKTSLPKKLRFTSADKVRELAELGGAIANLDNRRSFENEIIQGGGGVYLNLTQAQYERLKRP